MSLHADVGLRLGSLDLEARFGATATGIVAVVGPNGAGKTTLLRALAGLVPIHRGRVMLNDLLLDDPAAGVHLPPERRPVAVLFQDYLLFPHLSAVDNVAYGLRARGVRRAQARRTAAEWLDRLGLSDHAGRRPCALSGGQAQRVALARALVTEPGLLLLDEPLAAIDAGAKAQLRRDLRAQLASSPGIRLIVTHDPIEAMTIGDHLIVLEAGRITQQGPVAEVTTRPRSRWAAALVGLNLYEGIARDGVMSTVDGHPLHIAADLQGPVFALVHPRAVALHRTCPEGSARNVWRGDALTLDFAGDRARVQVSGPPPIVAEVTLAAATDLRLRDGGAVWISVKATEIDVYRA